MPSNKPLGTLGEFSFGWDNETFSKAIQSANFRSTLDESAALEIRLALPRESLKSLSLSALPKNTTFQWKGKTLFKGTLLEAVLHDFGVGLSYRDDLYRAKKIYSNGYFKTSRLEDCLSSMANQLGLSPRFSSGFSEEIGCTSYSGASLFEFLTELSLKHGFHFQCRSSSGQLHFQKLGQSAQEVTVDASIEVASLHTLISAQSTLSMGALKYFDPQTEQPQQKSLSATQIYSPLGPFGSHGGFKEKTSWKLAQGTVEAFVTDKAHFEKGDELLSHQWSKEALSGESLSLRLYAPMALPGDKITLKNSKSANLTDGTYLAHSLSVRIASATAQCEIVAQRA
jgi:hypothetical protein